MSIQKQKRLQDKGLAFGKKLLARYAFVPDAAPLVSLIVLGLILNLQPAPTQKQIYSLKVDNKKSLTHNLPAKPSATAITGAPVPKVVTPTKPPVNVTANPPA